MIGAEDIRDPLTWAYACSLETGESPRAGFTRVVRHLLHVLPPLARVVTVRLPLAPNEWLTLDERATASDSWQGALIEALEDTAELDLYLTLALQVESTSGAVRELVRRNSLSVEYSDDPEWTLGSPAVLVNLRVNYDVYNPVLPPEGPRHEQWLLNYRRLQRFLESVRDDLSGVFTYRNYPEVGPVGVLPPGASQEGLPPY